MFSRLECLHGNITLCSRRHVACQLEVERNWLKDSHEPRFYLALSRKSLLVMQTRRIPVLIFAIYR